MFQTITAIVQYFGLSPRIRKLVNKSQYFKTHCKKCDRIRSFSGPYFLPFGLNTETYSVNLRIHSECGKIRTRKTPNRHTFCAVIISMKFQRLLWFTGSTHQYSKGTCTENQIFYYYQEENIKVGLSPLKKNSILFASMKAL